MLLLLIAGVWIAALLLVAGLCAAADRGEADVLRAARARQAATEDARGTEPAEAALRIAA